MKLDIKRQYKHHTSNISSSNQTINSYRMNGNLRQVDPITNLPHAPYFLLVEHLPKCQCILLQRGRPETWENLNDARGNLIIFQERVCIAIIILYKTHTICYLQDKSVEKILAYIHEQGKTCKVMSFSARKNLGYQVLSSSLNRYTNFGCSSKQQKKTYIIVGL